MPEITPPTSDAAPGRSRWWRWVEPLLGIVLFSVAAWVLHHELQQVSYDDLLAALSALTWRAEIMAILFMIANYLLLTGFDLLAFVYIGKWIAPWRVMAASFVGYAISNNVGFTLLSGTSARYRFYSRWGLTPGDLSRVVVFYSGTFWVGLLLLGGWVLAFHPHPALGEGVQAWLIQAAGFALLLLAVGYAVAPFVRSEPIRIRGFVIPIPPPRLVFGQFLLSSLDWVLAASILYALLPEGGPGFGQVLGAFLAAQLIALVSHVPGGLGVFEGTMILLLGARVPTETLLGSLILFRIVYYLIPLVVALLILVADEVRQRRRHLVRLGSPFGSLAFEVAPKLLAVFLFAGGAVLLLSGISPSAPERMAWLAARVPLAAMEGAQVVGSVAGVGLMLLSHGAARRLRVAYRGSVALLVVGVAASLLKGWDYEEALLLCALLAVLIPTRGHFDRTAAFWRTRFTGGWVAAAVAIVLASAWLGFLAYGGGGYRPEMWATFGPGEDAPRALRATAAALVALAAFGLTRLRRPAPPVVPVPAAAEIEAAERLAARYGLPHARLLRMGDRALLWNEARDGFLIYTVHGPSWIALGDPVVAPEGAAELVRRFVELADDFHGYPVFHSVSPRYLAEYTDFGLTSVRVGERGVVPIGVIGNGTQPAPPGSVSFRVAEGGEAPAGLGDALDGDWRAHPAAGGALGISGAEWNSAYLAAAPVALLERDGRVLAFTSLWTQGDPGALGFDLLRFRADASDAPAELLRHLAAWGRAEGYTRLDVGVLPLPGLAGSDDGTPLPLPAPGALSSGGPTDPHPQWEARYLCYPGGIPLTRVVESVAALFADDGAPPAPPLAIPTAPLR